MRKLSAGRRRRGRHGIMQARVAVVVGLAPGPEHTRDCCGLPRWRLVCIHSITPDVGKLPYSPNSFLQTFRVFVRKTLNSVCSVLQTSTCLLEMDW